jgi:hypothetical protein
VWVCGCGCVVRNLCCMLTVGRSVVCHTHTHTHITHTHTQTHTHTRTHTHTHTPTPNMKRAASIETHRTIDTHTHTQRHTKCVCVCVREREREREREKFIDKQIESQIIHLSQHLLYILIQGVSPLHLTALWNRPFNAERKEKKAPLLCK